MWLDQDHAFVETIAFFKRSRRSTEEQSLAEKWGVAEEQSCREKRRKGRGRGKGWGGREKEGASEREGEERQTERYKDEGCHVGPQEMR